MFSFDLYMCSSQAWRSSSDHSLKAKIEAGSFILASVRRGRPFTFVAKNCVRRPLRWRQHLLANGFSVGARGISTIGALKNYEYTIIVTLE